MRLVEEKRLIRVELIILAFVVLSGVAIQYCSLEAEAHNAELLHKIADIDLTENVRISQKVSSLRYLLAAYAGADVAVDSAEVDSTQLLDPEFKRIVGDYKSGRITKQDYFNKLSVRHNRKSLELHEVYLSLLKEKNNLIRDEPVCSSLRYILSAVQFVAILFAIYIYYLIYRSIDKRTK